MISLQEQNYNRSSEDLVLVTKQQCQRNKSKPTKQLKQTLDNNKLYIDYIPLKVHGLIFESGCSIFLRINISRFVVYLVETLSDLKCLHYLRCFPLSRRGISQASNDHCHSKTGAVRFVGSKISRFLISFTASS